MKLDRQALARHRGYTFHAIKEGLRHLLRHRRKTPVYLVIGSPQSGKKALLRGHGAKPLDSNHLEAPWWTDEQTFFYVHQSNQPSRLLKKSLLPVMRWAKSWMPIQGVMVCLDIHQLYQSQGPQQTQSLSNINASLQAIDAFIKDCPVTVVCTKSDLIAGFQSTFADPTLVDHEQCLGFTTDVHNFHQAIEGFIKKLYDHALIRSQQEDDPYDKQNILDFPRQIDAIKDAIQSITQQIVDRSRLSLNRLCLTSVLQQQRPIDYLAKPLAQAYQVHAQNHEAKHGETIYFVRNLMRQVHEQGGAYAHETKSRYLPWLMIVALTCFGSTFMWHRMSSPPAISTYPTSIASIHHPPMNASTLHASLDQDLREQSHHTLVDLVETLQSKTPINDPTLIESALKATQTTLPEQLYTLALHLWQIDHPGQNNQGDRLYQQSTFNAWQQSIIPKAITLTRTLSQPFHHALLQEASPKTEKSLLENYLQHYVTYWSQQSDALKLSPPNNTNEAIAWLRHISEHDGPWQQQLRLAYRQTQATENPRFNQVVSNHFAWLREWEQKELPLMQKEAHQILSILENAQRANHPTQDLFNLGRQTALNPDQSAMGIMIHHSERNKDHMPWMNQGAHQIWHLLLAESAKHINAAWSGVYHRVHPVIAHQFPFDPQANTDIAPEQFIALFEHNGVMDRFFDLYLLAFTDQAQNYWQWKTIFGEKIPLHQAQLDQFIRAHLIQDMFFGSSPSSPGSTFSLTPIGLPDDVKTIRITLGDQSITYDHDAIPMMALNWPGQPPHGIRMTINKQNGMEVSYSKPGFWGLFHLINQHAHYDMDRQQAKITFTINGETIHLMLASKTSPNPFIPDVLNQFHLQESL